MADLELVEGEFGDNYDIKIKNPDGTDAVLTSFTGATLKIKTKNHLTVKLTKTLSITSPNVRWTIASGDTDFNGEYIAQVILTNASVTKKTKIMSVFITKKLD